MRVAVAVIVSVSLAVVAFLVSSGETRMSGDVNGALSSRDFDQGSDFLSRWFTPDPGEHECFHLNLPGLVQDEVLMVSGDHEEIWAVCRRSEAQAD